MLGSMTAWIPSLRTLGATLACAWLAACATPAPAPREDAVSATEQRAAEDTEARAQRIFRYESRVADALLDRFPLREDFVSAEPGLVAAEARMTEACGPLTRAVLRHLEGRKQSVKQKFKVAGSLDDCESAARAVEMLLSRPSQGLIATGDS